MRDYFEAYPPMPSLFHFFTSWAIPRAATVSNTCSRETAFYFLYKDFNHTFKCICTDLVFLPFVLLFLPPFWVHDGGTQAKYFEDSFGSTWGNSFLLPSVSTLDAAIIVFYMEKKLFALNSLLEENGFTFLECVRTPWQGWTINRIKKKTLCIYWTFILILFQIKWALYYM